MNRDGVPRWRALAPAFLAAAAVALVAVVFARFFEIFLLAFLCAMFGVFLHGVATLLAKRTKMSYQAGLAATALVLFGLGAGFLLGVGYQVVTHTWEMRDRILEAARAAQERLPEGMRPEKVMGDAGAEGPFRFLATTLGAVGNVVVIVITGLYFAIGHHRYRTGLALLFPREKQPRVRQVLHRLGATIWWWLLGRMFSMTVIATLATLGLWALGIPMPLGLGILTGVLEFIPNIGPILAMIPAVLLALQEGPEKALAVLAFYAAIQTLETYVLSPWVDKRSIELPPALTFLAQVLLGTLAGTIGVISAAPLVGVTLVLVNELWVQDVLGEEKAPAGTAPRHVYDG